MKKTYTLPTLILIITLLSPTVNAWYPEYSVLATEFPVRKDFLRPLQMHSTALLGMGEYFQYIYQNQSDFRFIDPTYPLGSGKHFFYMDLGSERLWGTADEQPGSSPIYSDLSSRYMNDYAFWSPYREFSHEQIPEPSLRLFYLTRLGESKTALTLGASYSLSYDETQFYQPYTFDYFRAYDALGASYESAESVTYDDYQLKETGDDESVSTEHQVNFFLSKAISQHLSIGARLGLVQSDVNGSYRDYQFNDRSDWSDEYESYWDDDLKRIQSTQMNDLNLGIAYTSSTHKRFALNGGIINGSLHRTFNEMDSSRYLSVTLNPDANPSTPDSNIYRSTSYYKSNKSWLYDGNGYYLRFLVELPKDETLIFRYGGLAEWRSADLTESESMLGRSDYFNQYWADWENQWRRYSSQSMVDMERTGSGSYQSGFYQLSSGIDWQLQTNLKFYGGLYLEHFDRTQDAREPFTGEKYAFTSNEGYAYDYNEQEATQSDAKTFVWQQHQWRSILAAPMGVEYQVLPAVGIQLGLTKVFERMRMMESYDVVVDEYRYVETRDGVVTRDDLDTEYVDGYEYPDIRTFDDRFDFSAGFSIRSGDRLKVSVVLTNAFQDQYAIKVGGSISW